MFEKIMTENFPNLEREKPTQVQEAERVPTKINSKRPPPRNIIIKMPSFKDKERISKATVEKRVFRNYYKGHMDKTKGKGGSGVGVGRKCRQL